LNNPKISNPVGVVSEDIRYLLTVSTTEGCVDTAGIQVTVFKGSAIYVPTGFTPNNDGLNDILKPTCIGIKSLSYFTIYNRWGRKVFTTNKLNEGWNGSLNGQNPDTGSFIWILKATDLIGKIYLMKGSFTLIR
jgi:gliding motility-associated-like protein